LFIDYDIIVPPNLISEIQKAFEEAPSLSVIFGSYDSKPTNQDVISEFRNLLHHYVHQTSNREAHTFWAGCGAIKKNIFDHLKGFDGEKYKMPSIEDIELGYRLAKHGYNINLLKEIQVTHQKKWTLSNMVKTDLFNRAIPWTKLILKEKAFYNDLNIKNKDIYSIAMVFVLFLSLIYSFFNLMAIGVVFLTFLIFFMLNFGFYGFLKNLKGLGFALKAIPLHILFYIICGTGFIIGTLEYYISKSNES
jgi:GT2 family glycosyltransferase